MKQKEYMEVLWAAIKEAGLNTQHVNAAQLMPVAHYMSIEALKAVVTHNVENEAPSQYLNERFVNFPPMWVKACSEELSERILLGEEDERKES